MSVFFFCCYVSDRSSRDTAISAGSSRKSNSCLNYQLQIFLRIEWDKVYTYRALKDFSPHADPLSDLRKLLYYVLLASSLLLGGFSLRHQSFLRSLPRYGASEESGQWRNMISVRLHSRGYQRSIMLLAPLQLSQLGLLGSF